MPIVAAELQARVGVEGATQAAAELKQVGAAFDAASAHAKASASGLNAADAAMKSTGASFAGGAKNVLLFGGAAGAGAAAANMLVGGIGALARGAVGLAGGLLQAHASMEQTEVAFKQLLGSGAAATEMMGKLRDLAAATPFEFPELAKNARLLLAFGDNAKEVVPHLVAIGDAVSALGGGSAEIDRVTRAIGQMESKGKILAEEMNQLSEIGINGFAILAQETGKTEAELRKLGETGQLAANTYIPLLYQGLERTFGGGMAAQAQTFNGLWSTLKDNIRLAAMEISKPFFDKAKDGLQRLVEYTKTAAFDEKVAQWTEKAEAFADSVVTNAPLVASALLDIAEALGNVTTGLLGLKQGWDDLPGPIRSVAKGILDSTVYIDDAGRALGMFNDLMAESTPLTREQAIAAGFSAQAYDEWAAAQKEVTANQALQNSVIENWATQMDIAAVSHAAVNTEMATGRERSLELHDANMTLADSYMELHRQSALLQQQQQAEAALAHNYTQNRDAQIRADEVFTRGQQELAFYTDKLAEAQQSLAAAYQIGLDIQARYTAQGSEYSQQAGIIERAIEAVNRKIADGSATTEDYNFILEHGEEALGRFEGGMDDAAITAGEYAIKNGLLMKVQDEINQQYPHLVAGSEEYNQKLREAALAAGISQEEFDKMTGPSGDIKSGLDGITQAIAGPDGLIESIKELPAAIAIAINAEVNREQFDFLINDLEMFNGSVYTANATVGFTASDGGDTYTAPPAGGGGGPTERKAQEMPIIGPGALTAAKDSASNAQQYIDLIDQIVGYMAEAAERMGDGMEAAQKYAELADSAVGAMLRGAELLRSLGESPVAYTEDAAESIAAIKFALEHAVTSLADSAALMSVEGMESAEKFASAADATANAMLSGLELLSALSEQGVEYGQLQERQIADLKFALEKAVVSLSESAAVLDMDGVAAAETLANAAGGILGALSDTLGFLVDLNEMSGDAAISARELTTRVHHLAENTRLIAEEFANAAEGWAEDVDPAVLALQDTIGAGSSALADTIDVLEAIAGQTDAARMGQREIAARAHQLSEDARLIAEQFALAGAEWQSGDMATFSDAVQNAADALSALPDAFAAISETSRISKEQTATFYDNFLDILDLIVQMDAAATGVEGIAEHLAGVAENIATAITSAAEAMGAAAAEGSAVLEAAAEMAAMLTGNLSPGPGLGGIDRGSIPKGGSSTRDGAHPTGTADPEQQALDELVSSYIAGIDAGTQSVQGLIDTLEAGGQPVFDAVESQLQSMASTLVDDLATALLAGGDGADELAQQLQLVQGVLESLEQQAKETGKEIAGLVDNRHLLFGMPDFKAISESTGISEEQLKLNYSGAIERKDLERVMEEVGLTQEQVLGYLETYGGSVTIDRLIEKLQNADYVGADGRIAYKPQDERDIVFEMNGREFGRLTGWELMRGKSMRRKLSPC